MQPWVVPYLIHSHTHLSFQTPWSLDMTEERQQKQIIVLGAGACLSIYMDETSKKAHFQLQVLLG